MKATPSSNSDEVLATTGQETIDILLDSGKLDEAAALALEVVEESCKGRKALAAAFAVLVGAMVQRSLVNWTEDVLTKALGAGEAAVTDVALEARAVPGRVWIPGGVADAVGMAPFDQAFGNDAVGVALTESAMDEVAVNVLCVGARGSLEMMRDARSGGKGTFAKRTNNGRSLMDAGFHVLVQVVGILEVAVTWGAVQVLVVALVSLILVAVGLEAVGDVQVSQG